MGTLPFTSDLLSRPVAPFHFNSSSNLLRIECERANNLGELLEAVRSCPQESIFQHTIQTLQEHHYIREGFSNDFAHWTYANCNEAGLAERLASIDVRAFTSISSMREQIIRILEEYIKLNPVSSSRMALEPFYFCSSQSVVIATPFLAHNLGEFIEALRKVTVHSIHHHFIQARLRLKLISNDFSLWLEKEIGLPKTAASLNRIDIYTLTLEGVRQQLIRILQNARQ